MSTSFYTEGSAPLMPDPDSPWGELKLTGTLQLQGPTGPTGPAGPQGDAGPAGAAGAPGPEGRPGDTGPAGPAGQQGERGEPGPKGDLGLTGDQGPIGPKGDRGPIGLTGEQGPIGPTGPRGLQGDQGPQGQQGIQGQRGETGITGERGPQGIQGPIGPKGDTGPIGPGGEGSIGPEGPAGPQGPKGDPGEFDPALLDGKQDKSQIVTDWVAAAPNVEFVGEGRYLFPVIAKDDLGIFGGTFPLTGKGVELFGQVDAAAMRDVLEIETIEGPAGPVGPAGPKGDTGTAGAKGDQGIQGIQGAKGDQGIQGPKGDTGAAGSSATQFSARFSTGNGVPLTANQETSVYSSGFGTVGGLQGYTPMNGIATSTIGVISFPGGNSTTTLTDGEISLTTTGQTDMILTVQMARTSDGSAFSPATKVRFQIPAAGNWTCFLPKVPLPAITATTLRVSVNSSTAVTVTNIAITFLCNRA